MELAREHGLTEQEYEWIKQYLGRTPNFTELGVYSVMWSEHCSYKNSFLEIRKLPNEGPQLLVGAGEENAGLVDLGDGLACAFKVESHNHPSAIEPYEGAATGVGGIHRDIFTMGARPLACLNSLRFGDLENDRVRFLLDGVVRGISDYGNSFGVPTVGGEIYFDDSYEGNPLVNAMSVGVVKTDYIAKAIARGPGNPVLVVGSSTGRDGIHGATFASEEISEESEEKRPSVQVGDPFTEKLLLEATLETIKSGAAVGVQDMGAAGLSSSSSEMSSKGGCGMEIDLDKVPMREEGMSAYELLLSESQERMLIVAEKGREQEIIDIYEKWDVNATVVGQVVEGNELTFYKDGEIKAQIPAATLADEAPRYEREAERPAYLDEVQSFDLDAVEHPDNAGEVLETLLQSPDIASKRWVYEQYDTMVRTNTVEGPGKADAGVIRIKGTQKGLSVKTDCNGRYVYLNPREGGKRAVAEAARNVVCTGARPVAITNCLNFGNPYKPEVYWVFKEALQGMGASCEALDTPVTGGNVSFYNENPEDAVYPTPVIGMLGILDDVSEHHTNARFESADELVYYAGAERSGLGGSEYLKTFHDLVTGTLPPIDLDLEAKLQQTVLEAIRAGLITAAHDLSDGGLAVAIAEMCIFSEMGAEVDVDELGPSTFDTLFSEAPSGIVLTLKPENEEKIEALFDKAGIPAHRIGQTGGEQLILGSHVQSNVEQLNDLYENALPKAMEQPEKGHLV